MNPVIKFIFGIVFVCTLLLSASSMSHKQTEIETHVLHSVLDKTDNEKIQILSDKYIKLNFILDLGNFDTLRLDNNTIVLVPKSLHSLDSLKPEKK